MSFNFAPKGWALCNGQLLPINQNQALFSLSARPTAATAASRSPSLTSRVERRSNSAADSLRDRGAASRTARPQTGRCRPTRAAQGNDRRESQPPERLIGRRGGGGAGGTSSVARRRRVGAAFVILSPRRRTRR